MCLKQLLSTAALVIVASAVKINKERKKENFKNFRELIKLIIRILTVFLCFRAIFSLNKNVWRKDVINLGTC
jgi:hypothetical protein